MNYCPICNADRKLLLCSGFFQCLECGERFDIDGNPLISSSTDIEQTENE